jgi:hypothetical protein
VCTDRLLLLGRLLTVKRLSWNAVPPGSVPHNLTKITWNLQMIAGASNYIQ